jgi:hypothetical protein
MQSLQHHHRHRRASVFVELLLCPHEMPSITTLQATVEGRVVGNAEREQWNTSNAIWSFFKETENKLDDFFLKI